MNALLSVLKASEKCAEDTVFSRLWIMNDKSVDYEFFFECLKTMKYD